MSILSLRGLFHSVTLKIIFIMCYPFESLVLNVERPPKYERQAKVSYPTRFGTIQCDRRASISSSNNYLSGEQHVSSFPSLFERDDRSPKHQAGQEEQVNRPQIIILPQMSEPEKDDEPYQQQQLVRDDEYDEEEPVRIDWGEPDEHETSAQQQAIVPRLLGNSSRKLSKIRARLRQPLNKLQQSGKKLKELTSDRLTLPDETRFKNVTSLFKRIKRQTAGGDHQSQRRQELTTKPVDLFITELLDAELDGLIIRRHRKETSGRFTTNFAETLKDDLLERAVVDSSSFQNELGKGKEINFGNLLPLGNSSVYQTSNNRKDSSEGQLSSLSDHRQRLKRRRVKRSLKTILLFGNPLLRPVYMAMMFKRLAKYQSGVVSHALVSELARRYLVPNFGAFAYVRPISDSLGQPVTIRSSGNGDTETRLIGPSMAGMLEFLVLQKALGNECHLVETKPANLKESTQMKFKGSEIDQQQSESSLSVSSLLALATKNPPLTQDQRELWIKLPISGTSVRVPASSGTLAGSLLLNKLTQS